MSRLVTDRLHLELYTDRDKAQCVELLTDPTVMRFVDKGPLNVNQAHALWRKLMLECYPNGFDTIWAVFAKDDRRYVGNASLRPRPEKQDDWEIGYYLKPVKWVKGYATEIASRLISYGFEVERGWTRSTRPLTSKMRHRFGSWKNAGCDCLEKELDEQGALYVYRIKI